MPDAKQEAQRERVNAVRKERRELAKNYALESAAARAELLKLPGGDRVTNFLAWLPSIKLDDADILVETIEENADWMRALDHRLRGMVRHQIELHIVKLRERAGLWPFDDALEMNGEDPNASLIIGEMLR